MFSFRTRPRVESILSKQGNLKIRLMNHNAFTCYSFLNCI